MVSVINKLQYNIENIDSKMDNIYSNNDPRELFETKQSDSVCDNINWVNISDEEFNINILKRAFKLYSESFTVFEVIPIEKPFSMGNVIRVFGKISENVTKPKYKILFTINMLCSILKTLIKDENAGEIRKKAASDIVENYIKYIYTYLD